MARALELTTGEVVEVIYDDKNPNLSYGIKAKLFDSSAATDSASATIITASPINSNILRIPLKGEIVMLLKGPSSYASGLSTSTEWYYIDIVNLQKDIHHNSIPTVTEFKLSNDPVASNKYNQAAAGNSNQDQTPATDKNFTESETVKPLQPYIGDVLIQGRYGNSIRMTTTPKSGTFSKPAKWKAGSPGAPITIIRNTEQTVNTRKINDFTTEDFKNEDNVIVMSSGQNIEFEQASGVLAAIKSKKITSWKDDNWGKTPQTLISSGRIIFNSWQKEIIAFAKNGIGLSSETTIAIDSKNSISLNSKKIELGDNATEPLILGNQFKLWINNLITALSAITPVSPVGPCLPMLATPQWASIESLRGQIDSYLSQVAFTKKLVNVVPGKSFTKKPSDRRLKDNLKLLGQSPNGINIYEFNFKSDPTKKYQGVMADELIGTQFQSAVTEDDDGYLIVDYSLIDVKFIPSFELTQDELNMYTALAQESKQKAHNGNLSESERLAALESLSLYNEKIKSKKDSSVTILLESPVLPTSLESMATVNKNYILINTSTLNRLSTQSIINGVNAARIALEDVGIVEDNSKQFNQRISSMLRNVNFRDGSHWAAAACTTWWNEAGITNEKFGTCTEWYNWAVENQRLSTTPVIGSIALFRYGVLADADQAGIVVEIDNDKNISIVEGDSIARYQTSGNGGVALKVVNPVAIIGYVLP
jgi:hypothetical protein